MNERERVVSVDNFFGFVRTQAEDAENANEHDLCHAFNEWAEALDAGLINPPAPGEYGFIGGTDREDVAFFVLKVEPRTGPTYIPTLDWQW